MRLSIAAITILIATRAAAAPLAIVGATVIDGTGRPAAAPGNVVVDAGRIVCAGAAATCPVPREARRFEAKGRFVMPGLVDAHVHFGQTGWIDGRPDGIAAPGLYPYAATVAALRADPGRWHRAYLCSGVTAAFDVGGQPYTVAAAQGTDARSDRVHVRAAGPLVTAAGERVAAANLPDQPTFIPLPPPAEAPATVARLKAMGSVAVKLWFIAPEPAQQTDIDTRVMALGAAARSAGMPFIAHATELRQAKVALRAGATYLVHSVFDRPVDAEFLSLLAANHAFYAPTLVVGGGWGRAIVSVMEGPAVTISDPNHCVDSAIRARIAEPERLRPFAPPRMLQPGSVDRVRARGAKDVAIGSPNLVTVYRAGGRVVLGTDAGNPLTLHGPSVNDELEAMQKAGIAAADLIPIATRNGAEAMGAAANFGTLEPGKAADLIVLARDPRTDIANLRALTHVMRAGVLKPQSELRVQ